MKIQALVAFIGFAEAFFRFQDNPFFDDWESEVAKMDCPYGPKRCKDREGNEVLCGE